MSWDAASGDAEEGQEVGVADEMVGEGMDIVLWLVMETVLVATAMWEACCELVRSTPMAREVSNTVLSATETISRVQTRNSNHLELMRGREIACRSRTLACIAAKMRPTMVRPKLTMSITVEKLKVRKRISIGMSKRKEAKRMRPGRGSQARPMGPKRPRGRPRKHPLPEQVVSKGPCEDVRTAS